MYTNGTNGVHKHARGEVQAALAEIYKRSGSVDMPREQLATKLKTTPSAAGLARARFKKNLKKPAKTAPKKRGRQMTVNPKSAVGALLRPLAEMDDTGELARMAEVKLHAVVRLLGVARCEELLADIKAQIVADIKKAVGT